MNELEKLADELNALRDGQSPLGSQLESGLDDVYAAVLDAADTLEDLKNHRNDDGVVKKLDVILVDVYDLLLATLTLVQDKKDDPEVLAVVAAAKKLIDDLK